MDEDGLGMKVAVASTDGKVVNAHFGHARGFIIVGLTPPGRGGARWRVLEMRRAAPACDGGEHSEGGMERAVENLRDCQAVLVARAGGGAKRALNARGIAVFEIADYIDSALERLYGGLCAVCPREGACGGPCPAAAGGQ
jgi:predicted Fe-Mo cluster-binding NifX family protein